MTTMQTVIHMNFPAVSVRESELPAHFAVETVPDHRRRTGLWHWMLSIQAQVLESFK